MDIKMINRTIAWLDFDNGVCVYVCITKHECDQRKIKSDSNNRTTKACVPGQYEDDLKMKFEI